MVVGGLYWNSTYRSLFKTLNQLGKKKFIVLSSLRNGCKEL